MVLGRHGSSTAHVGQRHRHYRLWACRCRPMIAFRRRDDGCLSDPPFGHPPDPSSCRPALWGTWSACLALGVLVDSFGRTYGCQARRKASLASDRPAGLEDHGLRHPPGRRTPGMKPPRYQFTLHQLMVLVAFCAISLALLATPASLVILAIWIVLPGIAIDRARGGRRGRGWDAGRRIRGRRVHLPLRLSRRRRAIAEGRPAVIVLPVAPLPSLRRDLRGSRDRLRPHGARAPATEPSAIEEKSESRQLPRWAVVHPSSRPTSPMSPA